MSDQQLYAHWRQAPWNAKRWPNFTRRELACRATGAFCYDPVAFDALQRMRDALGRPVRVTSGHRSPVHNAAVGGAPNSAHLGFAADVSLLGHDPCALYGAARAAGFSSFGFYTGHLHMDMRTPARRWYGAAPARRMWRAHFKAHASHPA